VSPLQLDRLCFELTIVWWNTVLCASTHMRYCETDCTATQQVVEEPVSPLYLRRNFPAPRPEKDAQPSDESLAQVLRGVVVLNRLECKVACTSCKVGGVCVGGCVWVVSVWAWVCVPGRVEAEFVCGCGCVWVASVWVCVCVPGRVEAEFGCGCGCVCVGVYVCVCVCVCVCERWCVHILRAIHYFAMHFYAMQFIAVRCFARNPPTDTEDVAMHITPHTCTYVWCCVGDAYHTSNVTLKTCGNAQHKALHSLTHTHTHAHTRANGNALSGLICAGH